MIRAGLLYGLAVALGFLAVAVVFGGCYATTGPVPTCAQNPWQPQCPPPIHDSKRPNDGGSK